MTSILVYTAEPMAAEGLKTVLGRTGGFEVMVVGTTASLIERASQDPFLDLVLMEVAGVDPQDAARLKQSLSRGQIIFWAREPNRELTAQAISLGIRGILLKTLPAERQMECLRRVHAGETWFDTITTTSSATRQMITPLQAEIMKLVARGMSNQEVTAELKVSLATVKKHVALLISKLGVADRLGLTVLAASGFKPTIGDRRRRNRGGKKPVRSA